MVAPAGSVIKQNAQIFNVRITAGARPARDIIEIRQQNEEADGQIKNSLGTDA
jgi:hypothetical protein